MQNLAVNTHQEDIYIYIDICTEKENLLQIYHDHVQTYVHTYSYIYIHEKNLNK